MSAEISRRAFLAGLGTAGALMLSACTAPVPPRVLRLACGERGGSYLQFGELLSAAWSQSGGTTLTAVPTEGSVENLRLLQSGDVDLALTLADAAPSDAGLAAVGRVYQNYLQCLVRADAPVASVADLAGRTVSLGAPGSGAAATAQRVLDVAGLGDPATGPVTVERRFVDAVGDLAAGRLDAVFWSGGVPTPEIQELAATTPVRVVDITSALPALRARYADAYVATSIPAGVYGATAPVSTIGIANLLVARADLEGDLVRRLVDTLIDDARVLVPEGALGIQYLTPASLIDTAPVELHPAAAQRYRERYG